MSGISEFTSAFFDASSKAWKKNKVRYDQACYTYKKGAFKGLPEIPSESPSKSALLRNAREINKRMSLKEEAPLPIRKSPRLQAEHRKQTYA
jgi:hypothetical protein